MNRSALSSKLEPHLATVELTSYLDKNFDSKKEIKPHIFDLGEWLLKGARKDMPTTPDTHLYRVRKAQKIARFIEANGYSDALAVPKKSIYWQSSQQIYYVASQKLDLSDEVAKPSEKYAQWLNSLTEKEYTDFGGQVLAYRKNSGQREITEKQAKGVAELCFLGYTDTNYNNQFFTKDGKYAIIDTEPQKRVLNKSIFDDWTTYLVTSKANILLLQALTGTAKLKLACNKPEAVAEIEKIERKRVLAISVKLIGQIALGIFISYAIQSLSAVQQLSTTAKFCLLLVIHTPVVAVIVNLALIHLMWNLSHQGIPGVQRIIKLETIGVL